MKITLKTKINKNHVGKLIRFEFEKPIFDYGYIDDSEEPDTREYCGMNYPIYSEYIGRSIANLIKKQFSPIKKNYREKFKKAYKQQQIQFYKLINLGLVTFQEEK